MIRPLAKLWARCVLSLLAYLYAMAGKTGLGEKQKLKHYHLTFQEPGRRGKEVRFIYARNEQEARSLLSDFWPTDNPIPDEFVHCEEAPPLP